MSDSTPSTQDATLDLINQVLDFIRANLQNIERTWGVNSIQYATTRDMMQKYWDANADRLKDKNIGVGHSNGINLDSKLEDLLAGLRLSSNETDKVNEGAGCGRDVTMS